MLAHHDMVTSIPTAPRLCTAVVQAAVAALADALGRAKLFLLTETDRMSDERRMREQLSTLLLQSEASIRDVCSLAVEMGVNVPTYHSVVQRIAASADATAPDGRVRRSHA
jgi:hypothetical protein